MATGDAANRDLTHPSWDEFFMGMAAMAAQRSKQAEKVGVIIANEDNNIVGLGYNGLPLHIRDEETSDDEQAELMCEAHSNAILFRTVVSLKGCTMYATKFPTTKECAKDLIQSRISELRYLKGPHHIPDYESIQRLLARGGVKTTDVTASTRTAEIKFVEVQDGQQPLTQITDDI